MKTRNVLLIAAICLSGLGAWYVRTQPTRPAPTAPGSPAPTPAPATASTTPDAPPAPAPASVPWYAAPTSDPVYTAAEVMVATMPGEDISVLAGRLHTWVLRRPGPSGYGLLSVPEGMDPDAFVQALQADPSVRDAARVGVTTGAQVAGTGTQASPNGQRPWYLDAARIPDSRSRDFAGTLVAVLDTGVAFEDLRVSRAETYTRAPALDGVPFLAPYDFVHDDEHPNDDHQHGTHIASLIAGRDGVAPGATILPVKVLDENERGTELDLVDGIWWAVDHGADVINLSLALSPWYAPSRALSDALQHARDEGVVVVAAAGNRASTFVSWPAADPRVIAVGAAEWTPDLAFTLAEYANGSPRVDLLAPGGNIETDFDDDGQPDGLPGASFPKNQPNEPGTMLMAGTSQAAAVVTGAVVHLLEAGASPDEIRPLLQVSADPNRLAVEPDRTWTDGYGAGLLDLTAALDQVRQPVPPWEREYHVRIVPFLSARGWGHDGRQVATPAARVLLTDAHGRPVSDVTVLGLAWADLNQPVSCVSEGGSCILRGLPETITDEEGSVLPLAWGFSVEGILDGTSVARPQASPPNGPCFAALTGALQGTREPAAGTLAYWWSEQVHPTFGLLAEAGVVLDAAPWEGARPFAVVFTPTVLLDGELAARTLRLDTAADPSCQAPQVEVLDVLVQGESLSRMPFTFASLDPMDARLDPAAGTCSVAMVLGDLPPATPNPAVPSRLVLASQGRPAASTLLGARILPLEEGEFRTRVRGTGAVEP